LRLLGLELVYAGVPAPRSVFFIWRVLLSVLGLIDFARQRIGVERFIMLSGEVEKDLETLREYYPDKVGFHPQFAGAIAFRAQAG
jgi:hypothetical protein